ncbi:VWA domain-containing protein [Alkalimarinus sediminis]|uniref:VWA domain-containing protein n=1 Tax=Alkalimarinus sediminis TaxID=1632866 RepID=A0A9E8HJG1_9ALTE|nr:VWA domain-containing protein [Alkalimarinus sediminis]UZW75795.1 VWA domain-containing protein [Alkalimarinus sediminis]
MSFIELASQFHFLRPLWLLALILVPIVLWLSTKGKDYSHSDWSKAIPPELLQHLMVGEHSSSNNTPQYWKWFAMVIAIMALGLAGPSWQQKPQPLQQQTDNLAIVLDLSLSMLASDQKPDRLTRAKHKLRDLLEQRKEGNTALIVYSGDSYVVTPLTDDINTLKSMLPPLDPFIMPAMGSRPDLGIAQAIEVLKNGGGSKGKILLITDGIEASNLQQVDQLLKDTPFSLSVLAVGTKEGGPINIPERGYLKDNGSVIIPTTDFELLDQLASAHSGVMKPITFSDSDIEALKVVTDVEADLQHTNNNEENDSVNSLYDQWHDEGYWFALLLIPLVLLGHRKGAFSLVLLLSFGLQPNEAMAFEWKNLWQTPDQQAMEVINEDPAKAAELFQNPTWKGTAHYRAKQFEEAQQAFELDATPTNLYNQATALAHQQKFEEALAAYNEVLEKDPGFTDAATNKALIEKFLEEQQSQDQQSSDQSEQNDSDSNDQQDQQQNQDQQSQNGDQKDSQDGGDSQSEQNSQQQNQSDKSNNDPSEQGESNQGQSEQQSQEPSQAQPEQKPANQDKSKQATASEPSEQQAQASEQQQAQASEQDELTDEETQAFEQWMRRVPDDPGGLLRRKFAQQYQQKQQQQKRGQQRQSEGQPIW